MKISGFNRRHLPWHIFVVILGTVFIDYGVYAWVTNSAPYWWAGVPIIACGAYLLGNQVRYFRRWQRYD